jgi:hypothetical protein
MLQLIDTWRFTRSWEEIRDRKRKQLAVWMAHGHSKLELRRLYAGPLALRPMDEKPRRGSPTPTKRGSLPPKSTLL